MIVVGDARLMGDGSGDASVSVAVDGGRSRQVRVLRDMSADYQLWATPSGDLRLIHPAAGWDAMRAGFTELQSQPEDIRAILAKGAEVMNDPRLRQAVMKAIAKRKEVQRRERIASKAVYVAGAIREMFSSGATHEEVMDAVNAALVKSVQEA